jgi:hypothetical protein
MATPASQLGRDSQEGKEKTCEADGTRLLPLAAEHRRVEFGAGEEREHDGPRAGQELDRRIVGRQQDGARRHADHKLGDRANDDFRERRRHLEPDRKQGGDQSQPEPQSGLRPHLGHGRLTASLELKPSFIGR